MYNIHEKIQSYFPYQFTMGQEQAIDDIRNDLVSGKQMQRLLHADVGAGKSTVIFYVAIGCALQNKRSLILVPTSILALQHFETLKKMGWGDIQLLTPGDKDQRNAITISTHIALNNKQLLKSITFLCVDEFVKFGVQQRAEALKYNPHLLLVSAVPIPRTLVMTVFGDLDISIIRELPIKRGPVVTRWVLPSKREQMYEIIDKELVKGKQVYVVYPRIDGGEDVESAEKGWWKLSKRFKYNVALLTGKDGFNQKAQTFIDFKANAVQILVSTIIAEIGLDCPNASVMVIEGADRFGLSQLHQLRGRICRSKDTTFCFMVSNTANEKSIARLDVMEKCNNGFEIAEYDLRLRGPGEMFSTRQHGLPALKFASLLYDYDLLVKARELAGEYIGKLDEPGNAGIKQMLEYKYGDTIKLGEIA